MRLAAAASRSPICGRVDDFKVMGDHGCFGEHSRGGAIFLDRQLDGTAHLGRCEGSAYYDEVHVNSGEHFRVLFRTLGIQLDHAVFDCFAALFEDVNNVKG